MGLYYTKRSKANAISHIRQLCIFCKAFNQPVLPVSKNCLLGFIELLSRSSGFGHISHVLNSIEFLHKCKGFDYIGHSFEFNVLLRGLKRKLAKPVKQALPITPEMLVLMYPYVNINSPFELAHWCAFLFGIRLLYRKSSLAPESIQKFDAKTGLSREKTAIVGNSILVYQNFSKTNQFMASTRVIPLTASPIQALDPVFHYSKLMNENPVDKKLPAFSYVYAGHVRCVTHRSFTNFLKLMLRKIGVDPDKWTGHSFRRGGASWLYRLGVDPLTIQGVGDWASDTFLRYLDLNFDRLWSAQQAMAFFTI